ncbi:MAG: hypothetical protein ACJ8GW_15610 [Massilia sp.]
MAPNLTRGLLRTNLLSFIALISSLGVLLALLDPDRVATQYGMLLVGVNGYSQFYAIYVGVRIAIAALALLAAKNGDQPLLGDITAMFLLAQPFGHLVAAFAIGLPNGDVLELCGLQLIGGVLLLALRPR